MNLIKIPKYKLNIVLANKTKMQEFDEQLERIYKEQIKTIIEFLKKTGFKKDKTIKNSYYIQEDYDSPKFKKAFKTFPKLMKDFGYEFDPKYKRFDTTRTGKSRMLYPTAFLNREDINTKKGIIKMSIRVE